MGFFVRTGNARRALGALLCALAISACSSTPAAPTPPPPPPVPDPPKITCPSPITLLAPQALPISVVYGTPTVINGAPPVAAACTPASGSTFPTGPSTVTCTATDNQQRTDSCSFAITVNIPPKISATRYVAFGDSMTAGEIVSGSGLSRTLRVIPEKAYPADLQKSLTDLYSTQAPSIAVANEGRSGETAADGYGRLRVVLSRGSYQVLTLMDGANDLASRDSAKSQAGLAAMWRMVQEAKNRGMKVFLATLPPQNKTACCPRYGFAEDEVPAFNDGIRYIADREAITLVDVFEAFHGDNTTLIDVDGLHPTPAGYQVIANAFFKAIQGDLQESSPSSFRASPFRMAPMPVPPMPVPQRRR